MVMKRYREALGVLVKKPIRLWGISLLSGLISTVLSILFGFAIGIGICIGILIGTGMELVYLHGLRGEQVYAVQLFDCCKDWATVRRVLCGSAWKSLWVFLWAIIPIVGPFFAIYKGYCYRLVPYILALEPDVKPTEAIKLSKERTMGFKGSMFLADFLVYIIIFVAFLVLALLGLIPYIGIIFKIIYVIAIIIVALFINLFMGLVRASYYERITNGEPAPSANAGGPAAGGTFCPNCGAPCAADSAFCPNCGAPRK